jgi:hypothetical protein
VLLKYGITLRDTNNSFRDMSDVLSDAAEKYNELGAANNTVGQGQITTALAGLRQANYLAALFQNWDKVKQAQEVARNSAGMATDRYTIYMQSIEAATNEFKTSWQEMWSATISDKTIKDIINLGTSVLELITKMGGLVPVLESILVIVALIKKEAIIGFIGSAISSVSTLIPGLKALAGQMLYNIGVTNTFAASQEALATSTAMSYGIVVAAIYSVIEAWRTFQTEVIDRQEEGNAQIASQ